ncbi:MAG TPA: DoxX-like family protein [Actinomycetota bacterium]
MSRARRVSLAGLITLMGGSGIAHVILPEPYLKIVPRWVPSASAAVFLSGIAELAVAAALAHPRTRRVGAWATVALLVAVYPANIQHALDAEPGTGEWWATRARLPLQPVLIWWGWIFTRAKDEASP